MSSLPQIRNVPDETHRALKARAAQPVIDVDSAAVVDALTSV
jgi:plasmid stability protein